MDSEKEKRGVYDEPPRLLEESWMVLGWESMNGRVNQQWRHQDSRAVWAWATLIPLVLSSKRRKGFAKGSVGSNRQKQGSGVLR